MRRYLFVVMILTIMGSCKNQNERSIPETKQSDPAFETPKQDTLSKLLKVTHPTPGQLVTSPLHIEGEARGYWFFEASATVELIDETRQQLGESYITAKGDWMTEDWVEFSGNLDFEKPVGKNGFLVLHKANPSGMEERDISDTIKVRFQD